jgi:hypothetical protein
MSEICQWMYGKNHATGVFVYDQPLPWDHSNPARSTFTVITLINIEVYIHGDPESFYCDDPGEPKIMTKLRVLLKKIQEL